MNKQQDYCVWNTQDVTHAAAEAEAQPLRRWSVADCQYPSLLPVRLSVRPSACHKSSRPRGTLFGPLSRRIPSETEKNLQLEARHLRHTVENWLIKRLMKPAFDQAWHVQMISLTSYSACLPLLTPVNIIHPTLASGLDLLTCHILWCTLYATENIITIFVF